MGNSSATDIAFSLGVLSLLGKRVPLSLKVFLTALAIIDDLGAIVIIALFYSGDLSIKYLSLMMIAFIILLILNRYNIKKFLPYLLVGLPRDFTQLRDPRNNSWSFTSHDYGAL